MKRDAYSRADETRTADGGRIRQFPRFTLEVWADEPRNPTEYTIFEHGADIDIRWITIDADHAVPVEEVA